MPALARMALALALASACGDGLVDARFRGAPLFEVEATLRDYQLPSEASPIRAAIFWVPYGLGGADMAALLEDREASLRLSFPEPLLFRVFTPPPRAAFGSPAREAALGVVLLYADRDEDARFTADRDRVLGGAPEAVVAYVRAGFTDREPALPVGLPPGFHILPDARDLRCHVAAYQPHDACGVPLGARCAGDEDCGALGRCLTSAGDRPLPGGYCAIPGHDCERRDARPAGGALAGHLVLGCAADDDCRVDEGYVCEGLGRSTAVVAACGLPERPRCDARIGAACRGDADCGADARCLFASEYFGPMPGGTCVSDLPYWDAPCHALHGSPARYGYGQRALFRACRLDADCRVAEGYRCERALEVCLPAPTESACRALGGPCEESADCGPRGSCLRESLDHGTFPGGYCSAPFGADGCRSAEAVIDYYSEEAAWSLRRCRADADCRADEGYWCDRRNQRCLPPPTGSCTVDLGAPCPDDAACGPGGRCLGHDRGSFLPRFAAGYCSVRARDAGCRSADGPTTYYEGGAVVLQRCAEDRDCRPEHRCDPLWSACLPPRRIEVSLPETAFSFLVPLCR